MLDLTQQQIDDLYNAGHISDAIYSQLQGPNIQVPDTGPLYGQMAPNAPTLPENQNVNALAARDMYLAQNNPGFNSQMDYGTFPQGQAPSQGSADQQLPLSGGWGPSSSKLDRTQNPNLSAPREIGSDELFQRNQQSSGQTYNPPLSGNANTDAALRAQQYQMSLSSDPKQAQQAQSMAPSLTDNGYEMQKQGVQDFADASSKKTNEQSAIMNKGIEQQWIDEKNRQAAEVIRQQKIQDKITQIEDAANKVASMEVDPNKFWGDRSTGSQIMMGIGLALGSFGSTPDNKVVGLLNQAVDKDIALQKWQIANARDNLTPQFNVLNQMRNLFGDERQAEEATRIAALERIKMQVAQKALQYSDPEVQAKAKQTIGELDVLKNAAKQKAANSMQFGGASTFGERMQYTKDQGERTIDGLGMVSDARDAPEIRKRKGVTDNVRDNLSKLIKLVERKGRAILPGSEDAKIARTLAGDLQLDLKEVKNLGVPTGKDLEMLDKLITTDPTAIFQMNALPQLKETKRIIERGWRHYLKPYKLNDPTLPSENEETPRTRGQGVK